MPIHFDKESKKIYIILKNKQHWKSKDVASLFINGSSILVSALSGVANLAVAFGGSAAFYFTQLFFSLNNKELRDKIVSSKEKYRRLRDELKQEGYTIELDSPQNFSEFGLHTTTTSAFISSTAAVSNLLLQAAAAANAATANFTNYNHNEAKDFCDNPMKYHNQTVIDEYCDTVYPSLFEYCKESTCLASYVLFGLAIASSSAEQHFKRVNLECWSETLDEAIKYLEQIKLKIEFEETRRNSITLN